MTSVAALAIPLLSSARTPEALRAGELPGSFRGASGFVPAVPLVFPCRSPGGSLRLSGFVMAVAAAGERLPIFV